jgi:hypothetical protein
VVDRDSNGGRRRTPVAALGQFNRGEGAGFWGVAGAVTRREGRAMGLKCCGLGLGAGLAEGGFCKKKHGRRKPLAGVFLHIVLTSHPNL